MSCCDGELCNVKIPIISKTEMAGVYDVCLVFIPILVFLCVFGGGGGWVWWLFLFSLFSALMCVFAVNWMPLYAINSCELMSLCNLRENSSVDTGKLF